MLDMQKQRLRHLVSNAILELWKKETGSLSSVLIEGTVCISSGSGRTIVVQMRDRYSGCIPGVYDNNDEGILEDDDDNHIITHNLSTENMGSDIKLNLSRSRSSSSGNYNNNSVSRGTISSTPSVFQSSRTRAGLSIMSPISALDYKQGSIHGNTALNTNSNNMAAVQAYFDELSPASLVSPTNEIAPGSNTLGSINLKQQKQRSNPNNNNNDFDERPPSSRSETDGILQKSNGMDSGIGAEDIDIDVTTSSNKYTETKSENRSALDFSINQMKDDFLSDDEAGDEDEADSLNNSRNSAAGPVCPGTGYYTSFNDDNDQDKTAKKETAHKDINQSKRRMSKDRLIDNEEADNNNDKDYALNCNGGDNTNLNESINRKRVRNTDENIDTDDDNDEDDINTKDRTHSTWIEDFSTGDETIPGPMMSTPKISKFPRKIPRSPNSHSPRSISLPNSLNNSLNLSGSGGSNGILDLTSGGLAARGVGGGALDDLALSLPGNYTAQVRDVIRQRLLAHKVSIGEIDSAIFSDSKDYTSTSSISESPSHLESSKPTSSEYNTNLPHNLSTSSPHNSTPSPAVLHSSITTPPSPLIPSPSQPALLPPTFPYGLPTPNYKGAMMPYELFAHLSRQNHRLHPGLMTLPASVALSSGLDMSSHHKLAHPYSMDRSLSGASTASSLSSPDQPVNLVTNQDYTSDLNSSFSESGKNNTSSSNEAQKVYKCDFCSKTFLFKSKYHEHLPVHTNARPFQCRLCSRTYKYKYDLRVHLRTHMGIPTKSTVCPFCNAKFDTNKLLRLHIRDAHKERHRVTEEECTQMYEGVV